MNPDNKDNLSEEKRPEYEPPRVEKIELTPDETLATGCKTDTFGDCLQPTGPTFEYGS